MKLPLLLACLGLPVTAVAGAVTIDFDELRTGNSYVEDGYRFTGPLTRDMNFPSSPSLRLYGNGDITISRVDGGEFSMTAFTVQYLYTPDEWFIENQNGSGFGFSRGGEFRAGQYPETTMRNVRRLHIFDPKFSSANYYIFDHFELTSVSAVPEPSTLSLALLGFAAVLCAYAVGTPRMRAARSRSRGDSDA
jgi:hypothetical protein